MQYLIGIMTFLTSLFLILLILIQRGRGGGLAGALGGMGGQSAFGTKAGDLFTRITIVVAAFWILLSVAAISLLNKSHSVFGSGGNSSSVFSPGKDQKPGTEIKSDGTSTTDSARGSGLTGDDTSTKSPVAPAGEAPAGGGAPADGAPAGKTSAPAGGVPAAEAPAPAAAPATSPPTTPSVPPATTPEKE